MAQPKQPRMISLRLAALVVAFVALAELLVFVVVSPHDVPVRGPSRPHVWNADEKAIVDRYFAEHAVRKVQIGAGPNDFPDWLNTDIAPTHAQVYLDATKPLPFADGSIRYVYAEQVIEHIEYDAALAFLKECHRVLEPGGRVRLATPNLDHMLALFAPQKTPIQQQFLDFQMKANHLSPVPRTETAVLNLMMHAWGHQFLYDPETLHATLRAAGFEPVDVGSGESSDPALRGIERHWAVNGGKELDDFTSMFVEGVRTP